MNRTELLRIIEARQLAPNRKLGQNFLVDGQLRDFIVRKAGPVPEDQILEVGPGLGVLTGALLKCGAAVTAIEIDRGLCRYLRETIDDERFRLVEGDACRTDFASLFGPSADFRCISNLPYSISSPLLAHFLESRRPPSDMLLMLQKETAERIAAGPGNPSYGSLSVQIAYTYEAQWVRNVSRQVFYPVPDVDSALLRLRRRDPFPTHEERLRFNRLVRTAFSHRRKKMFKMLAGTYGKTVCDHAFRLAGIATDVRAEQLDFEEFGRFQACLDSASVE